MFLKVLRSGSPRLHLGRALLPPPPRWLPPSSGQALCILASSHTPIPLHPGGGVTMKPSLSGFLQGHRQSLHNAGPALYRQPVLALILSFRT